jgi:hypothetical protein
VPIGWAASDEVRQSGGEDVIVEGGGDDAPGFKS